eukprot:2039634-Karenia_brevis.AAC.1
MTFQHRWRNIGRVPWWMCLHLCWRRLPMRSCAELLSGCWFSMTSCFACRPAADAGAEVS